MNDRKYSIVTGTFCFLNTVQFLIFEVNEFAFFGYEETFSVYQETKSELVSWVVTHKKSISVGLSTVTLLVCSLLLYCVHAKNYVGMLCYSVWIIIYELLSLSIILLANRAIKEQFKELRYLRLIFQISRMLLHLFCLPFVTKYGYSIFKDPRAVSKIGQRRRSSISTVESWPPVRMGSLYYKMN
ncbi:putative transmembrane protein 217B [Odocoileus virginianus]|uniref:Transmembrane protein 217 isoform X3 n=1 Tax=Odocoileus virginianus TaxID=9874 RepID=A0A6J0WXL5_ODOVR|nr:transmembrane protein 217 isoform X3 [Odocoileus virginianus texanus]XP_020741423.1 transmembrane protein 217 isoform X3 [Odocoileus virginianus texanus]XP_020741424.1 transmembrane protein 217 isoform X3 [Odocoileus virginianus texanus]XP_020741425.1 transmembrane protein 217 isoform X3 [Odocoileus virginianus texanus]